MQRRPAETRRPGERRPAKRPGERRPAQRCPAQRRPAEGAAVGKILILRGPLFVVVICYFVVSLFPCFVIFVIDINLKNDGTICNGDLRKNMTVQVMVIFASGEE